MTGAIARWIEIADMAVQSINGCGALLRRRARDFGNTDYLKLKIYQLNTPDTPSFRYGSVPAPGSATRMSTV